MSQFPIRFAGKLLKGHLRIVDLYFCGDVDLWRII